MHNIYDLIYESIGSDILKIMLRRFLTFFKKKKVMS